MLVVRYLRSVIWGLSLCLFMPGLDEIGGTRWVSHPLNSV